MNKERTLMLLVAADVILAFSVIGSEMMFDWTLPGTLRDYVSSRMTLPSNPWEVALAFLWGASVGCTVVAWVALLNLWWFARRLYVVAWASWTLLVLLSGPSVLNPLGAMFDTLESLVAGAILGLVYFSDLSRAFERNTADVQARPPATV